MMKWLLITSVLIVVGLSSYVYHYVKLRPPLISPESIELTVPSGITPIKLSKILSRHHDQISLPHPYLTEIAFRFFYHKKDLQAGVYHLFPHDSLWTWLNKFQAGRPKLFSITFPEGATLKEIAQILVDQDIIQTTASFLALTNHSDIMTNFNIKGPSIEGYFFPSTYHLPKKYGARPVIEKALSIYQTQLQNLNLKVQHSYLKSPHAYLILASIIEKETGSPEERSRISGVFHNRMKKKMRLESDPTTIYGIKDFKGDLVKRHLQTWSPYNTYVIKGLPLGPICNPGLDAIYAAYHPESHNYFFFVSKNDGTHVFSETYSQHEKYVKKYQLKN
jgi:UPF0755 protein